MPACLLCMHTLHTLMDVCMAECSMRGLQYAGATLSSFGLALLFFTSELLYFKTLSLKSALQPLIVAGVP